MSRHKGSQPPSFGSMGRCKQFEEPCPKNRGIQEGIDQTPLGQFQLHMYNTYVCTCMYVYVPTYVFIFRDRERARERERERASERALHTPYPATLAPSGSVTLGQPAARRSGGPTAHALRHVPGHRG